MTPPPYSRETSRRATHGRPARMHCRCSPLQSRLSRQRPVLRQHHPSRGKTPASLPATVPATVLVLLLLPLLPLLPSPNLQNPHRWLTRRERSSQRNSWSRVPRTSRGWRRRPPGGVRDAPARSRRGHTLTSGGLYRRIVPWRLKEPVRRQQRQLLPQTRWPPRTRRLQALAQGRGWSRWNSGLLTLPLTPLSPLRRRCERPAHQERGRFQAPQYLLRAPQPLTPRASMCYPGQRLHCRPQPRSPPPTPAPALAQQSRRGEGPEPPTA